jgi:hypothetical protein
VTIGVLLNRCELDYDYSRSLHYTLDETDTHQNVYVRRDGIDPEHEYEHICERCGFVPDWWSQVVVGCAPHHWHKDDSETIWCCNCEIEPEEEK